MSYQYSDFPKDGGFLVFVFLFVFYFCNVMQRYQALFT